MQSRIVVLSGVRSGEQLSLADAEVAFSIALTSGNRRLKHGDRITVGDAELLFLTGEEAEDVNPVVYLDDAPREDTETVDLSNSAVQLYTLIDVANAFRNTRDMPAIRKALIDLIFTSIPAERVAILLKDSDSAEFQNRNGRCRRDPERFIEASRSIVNRVYKENAPIFSNDLDASGLQSKSLRYAKVRSLVCVPMATFDRKYGVIYADTSNIFVRFDKDTVDWLMTVATMAALALATSLYIEDELRQLVGPHNIVGGSAPIMELHRQILQVARTKSTVLILGETGTGKELVARAIHLSSSRAEAQFVAVNCATLGGDLLENELFGHEKDAFTGATTLYRGKLERASGGTLFLDEVAELPLTVQAKLLRVLQEKEFERVGGSLPIRVDIRVIAATNRDLDALTRAGVFREDLLHRLKVVPIRTPPLRNRREDILPLARHFLFKYAKETAHSVPGISAEAEALLLNYAWPGNVRELENTMERAIVCSETHIIRPEDLHLRPPGTTKSRSEVQNYYEFTKQSKIEFLANAVTLANGDRNRAAASIGLHRNSLDRLMRQLDMTELLE